MNHKSSCINPPHRPNRSTFFALWFQSHSDGFRNQGTQQLQSCCCHSTRRYPKIHGGRLGPTGWIYGFLKKLEFARCINIMVMWCEWCGCERFDGPQKNIILHYIEYIWIHLSLHGSRRRKKLLLKRASCSGTSVLHLRRSVLFVTEHESIDAWVHDFEIQREVNPLVVRNNLLYLFVCRCYQSHFANFLLFPESSCCQVKTQMQMAVNTIYLLEVSSNLII